MHRIALYTMVLLSGSAFGQAWESAPALPTGGVAKIYAVGINDGGTIYAMGGAPWINGEDGSVYSLNLGSLSWVEETSFDGFGPVISQGGGIDSLGRIVIFGGTNTEAIEPAASFHWTPEEGPWFDLAMRSSSAPANYFAYCTDNTGRLYSFGGGGGESGSNQTRVERYIASSDSWQVLAPMPVAAGDAAAVDDGTGHILVIGGVSANGNDRLTEVQQYNIASGTWSTTNVPDLPVAVSAAKAVRDTNGKIYLIGGRDGPTGNGQARDEVLIYDPGIGAWKNGPSMSTPRYHFGAVLGSDDFIYAIGGANSTGGTNTVEKLHPTDCPVFNQQPASTQPWRGSTLRLQAAVVGSSPISLQWRRNGVDLANGPTAHGSVISGVDTDSLSIANAQADDSGNYVVVAQNACGTSISDIAEVSVRVQVALPTHWTVTSLHPSYAETSYAYDVDNRVQVGKAVFDTPEYNNIDHPMIWRGSAASGINATPAGSQGGAINAISGDTLVGWWWRPFNVVGGTEYYRRAGIWDTVGNHRYPTATGWEYHSMSDTDGTWHVGSQTNHDASGNYWTHAVIWREPTLGPIDLHPTGYSSSFLSAMDGDDQFGSVNTPYPAPSPRAAKWSGTRDSFVSLHPDGAVNSGITGAGDGQQVGVINRWNNPVPGVWSGTADSFTPFVMSGVTSLALNGCMAGMQFGAVQHLDGTTSAYLWRGYADEGVDVGSFADPNITGTSINGMDIEPDGTIVVVGSGYNQTTGRHEALMWRSTIGCGPADRAEPFGVLDFFDVAAFLGQFSAGDPAADFNNDSVLDFFDVAGYLSAFSAGCP